MSEGPTSPESSRPPSARESSLKLSGNAEVIGKAEPPIHRRSDGRLDMQQRVYLETNGNISGLKMKTMAMKLRHQLEINREKNVVVRERLSTGYSGFETENVPFTEFDKRWIAFRSILFHPFSVLLVAFPCGIAASYLGWNSLSVFWLNVIAMIPLAKVLGDATEELADALHNDTLSGLINATFGNLVEMILTVQTLRKGLLNVVKATLLGSILSNLLLVLGSSFFLGGLSASPQRRGKYHIIHTKADEECSVLDQRYEVEMKAPQGRCSCITLEKEQIFTVKGALVNMAMHFLSILTIALPTLFAHSERTLAGKTTLEVSRYGSVIILLSYALYLVFHLGTHKNMLALDEADDDLADDEEVGNEPDDAKLGLLWSLILMMSVSVLIGVSSELLVEAIEDVIVNAKLPSGFIGVIVLPFAGNACEHASALRFAIIDRPGLAIGIAVGSTTQIALLLMPFAVLIGWMMDQPMDLNFGFIDLTILFLSTLVVLAIVLDGRSNWLKGGLLFNAYIFIAILYWCSGDANKS